MAKTILAVGIGDPLNSRLITRMTQSKGTRPYITGLIFYLSQQQFPNSNPVRNYTLGADYTIDYHEFAEGSVTFPGSPDVIFCMSTPVVRQAHTATSAGGTPVSGKPVVGIFSDQSGEGFDKTTNICGVNAQRFQIAAEYYHKFLTMVHPLPGTLYVLHRNGNTASNESWGSINGIANKPVQTVQVAVNGYADIEGAINKLNAGSALLVLPVDLFFGAADDINRWAKARSLRVFWPAADWVPPALGSFGLAQEICGESMSQLVQYIFEHNQIPTDLNQRFITLDPTNTWVGSHAVAKALKLQLIKHAGLRIV